MSAQERVNIGRFRFGLGPEAHAHAVAEMGAAVRDLDQRGTVPTGTTYAVIAEAMIDTLSGYTSIGEVTPEDFPDLVRDALDQLDDEATS